MNSNNTEYHLMDFFRFIWEENKPAIIEIISNRGWKRRYEFINMNEFCCWIRLYKNIKINNITDLVHTFSFYENPIQTNIRKIEIEPAKFHLDINKDVVIGKYYTVYFDEKEEAVYIK